MGSSKVGRFSGGVLVPVLLLLVLAVSPSRLLAQTASLPLFRHVFIVVEENHGYSEVVGNSSMPYLNSLIANYGLATNYVADTHPSIGNYMVLATGQILTNDDSQTPSSFPVSDDNIVRELVAAGKTWKSYAEDLPSVGYTGGDSGNYAVRHNPPAYLTDVQNSSTEVMNLVPFTEFASDLAGGSLPNFSFIVPNVCDDAHDCSLSTADSWLQTNIDPLIKSPVFQANGLLLIVFDEDSNTGGSSCTDSDVQSGTWCGGQVAAVVVSPLLVSAGFQSSVSYHHESLLRLMEQGLGVTVFPGLSSSAANLSDFFGPSTGSSKDFSLAAGTTSQTVSPGGTAQYTLKVSPVNGFNQTVNLGCSGAPASATCSLNPASATLDGTHSVTVQLTVITTAPAFVAPGDSDRQLPPPAPLATRGVWWSALLAFLVLRWGRRGAWGKRLRFRPAWALAGILLLVALWSGCGTSVQFNPGNHQSSGTPAGTFTLTVTATAGNLSHAATVQLMVQ